MELHRQRKQFSKPYFLKPLRTLRQAARIPHETTKMFLISTIKRLEVQDCIGYDDNVGGISHENVGNVSGSARVV